MQLPDPHAFPADFLVAANAQTQKLIAYLYSSSALNNGKCDGMQLR